MTDLTAEPKPVVYDRLTMAMALSYVHLSFALGLAATLGALRDQFDLSATVASLHGGFFGWGLLLAGASGKRLAHIGAKPVFLAAVTLSSTSVAIYCLGPSVAFTLAGAFGVGVGGALMVVVVPGVLAAHHRDRFGAVFAAVNAWPALVGIFASALIGIGLATSIGWRPAYLVPSVVAGAIAIVVARGADFPVPTSEPGTPWRLFAVGRFRAVWALMVVGVITEFSLVIWGALFLKDVAGVADGWAPPLSAFFAVGVLVGRFATPYVLLRMSGARLTQLGFVTAGIGGLLLWAADPLAIRLAALAIVGVGVAPIYPLVMEQLFATAPDEQARLSAAAAMASGLAISVGPLVLGVFADAVGLRSAILGLAVSATVGLIGSILITRPRVVSQ